MCDSVKAWSDSRPRIECRSIYPPQAITRTLPLTIESDAHPAFTTCLHYEIPEKYLTCIPGARLVGSNGLVILPDGSFAAEVVFSRGHLEADPAYSRPLPKPVIEKRGRYYSLLLLWSSSGNYYHWLHDVLLRPYRVADLLPGDIRLIVPADLRPYQRETLRYLGIPDERLEFFSGDEVWRLESLYFSPPTSRSGHDSPEADRWLRDSIFSACDITAPSRAKRIYISRRRATHWKISNEHEVEACLRRYGFETYVTEAMSVRDQAALFSQAEVIVSNQGSGLTNILFAPSGAKVLDIQDPTNVRYCYWTMSEALGHQYWYLWGQTISRPESKHGVPDLFVPVDKLTATLDRMLPR